MTQSANSVVIAGAPVALHADAREVVILRMALVVPGPVDEVHEVVDSMINYRPEQLHLWAVLQVLGELFEQIRHGPAEPLDVFEAIGAGPGSTGILDFLFAGRHFRHGARQLAVRTP